MDTVDGTRAMETVETSPNVPAKYKGHADGASAAPGANSEHNQQFLRPALYGLVSAAGLLAFYLGIITLAQDWQHALQQLGEDRWFVAAISAGFGLQVALFTFLRTHNASARAGGVVASTGTSTGAMLACCAHHLADLLPIVGLSGAAAFLDAYKTPLLWLAIVMNAAGVAYMVYQIRKHRVTQAVAAVPGPSCHIAAP